MAQVMDLAIALLTLASVVACSLNTKIRATMEPPQGIQDWLQLIGFQGGLLTVLLLHRRLSGTWASPFKLLLLSGAFWLCSESLDFMLGGMLIGEHPWNPEKMQVPLIGSMPLHQPLALQAHAFLSLQLADQILPHVRPLPVFGVPRAVLAAVFATLLDAAAEPAWLSLQLYSYSACKGAAATKYCILNVDPKNYVAWFVIMFSCYWAFHLWDGRATKVPVASSQLLSIPYCLWLGQLVWYQNLIRGSDGTFAARAFSLMIGLVPLACSACVQLARAGFSESKMS